MCATLTWVSEPQQCFVWQHSVVAAAHCHCLSLRLRLQALAPATHATHPLKGGCTELTIHLSICSTYVPAYLYTSKQADMSCSLSITPSSWHKYSCLDGSTAQIVRIWPWLAHFHA